MPPHRPVRTPQSHSAVRPLRSLPVQCQLLAARSRTLFASAHALLLSFMGNSSTRRPKHGEARIFRSQNIGIFPLIGLLAIYPRPLSPPIAYHRAARPVEDAAAGRPLSTPCSAQSAYTELGSNLLGCLSEQNVPQGRRAFRPPLSERACTDFAPGSCRGIRQAAHGPVLNERTWDSPANSGICDEVTRRHHLASRRPAARLLPLPSSSARTPSRSGARLHPRSCATRTNSPAHSGPKHFEYNLLGVATNGRSRIVRIVSTVYSRGYPDYSGTRVRASGHSPVLKCPLHSGTDCKSR